MTTEPVLRFDMEAPFAVHGVVRENLPGSDHSDFFSRASVGGLTCPVQVLPAQPSALDFLE